jgi:hypothetical protein
VPTLSFDIGRTTWQKLDKVRTREGLNSVRLLCLERIYQAAAEAECDNEPPRPEQIVDEAA